MNAEHESMRAAGFMAAARVANMAIGLITIPVLIANLGTTGFAAWAVFLAMGAVFWLLELGIGAAMVRDIAISRSGASGVDGRDTLARGWVLLALLFGLPALLMGTWAGPVATLFQLPESGYLGVSGAVVLVYGAVALRAFLQVGPVVLSADRQFGRASLISLTQTLCANLSAAFVAWHTQLLDLTLVAYWGAQCLVLCVGAAIAGTRALPRFRRTTMSPAELRRLAGFGMASQADAWASVVNFQLDKFLLAAWIGLPAVAPYEVANRSVAALRSIPASGADSFLPIASALTLDRDEAWRWYESSTRLAGYGVIAFLLAPLVIAPPFLLAWAAEVGWMSRWAFLFLCIGAAANVLALPASVLMQSSGRPDIPGRVAVMSIGINVALSVALVLTWGMAGAALGTGIAMMLAAMRMVHVAHREFRRPLAPTLRLIRRLWPLATVCLLGGMGLHLAFEAWAPVIAARPDAPSRLTLGLSAVGLYALLLAVLFNIDARRGDGLTSNRRSRKITRDRRSRAN